MSHHLREPVGEVLRMLANKAYQEVADLTGGDRLSADEISRAIADYGRELVLPPEQAYESIDAIIIEGSNPPSWSVHMPLWTNEEGRSDLTLEMTITGMGKDVRIEIDDIHVL